MSAHFDKGSGHLRVGKLLVCWPIELHGAPVLDGASVTFERVTIDGASEQVERVTHGGVAIRVPCRDVGASVAWRGARVPAPGRWLSWRFVWAQLKWRAAGRPLVVKVYGGGEGGPRAVP